MNETGDAAPATEPVSTRRRGSKPPPEMSERPRRKVRLYLTLLFLAALLLLVAVGTLNALVDPYGILGTGRFPTATTSDRSIKADLIQNLSEAPQLIVRGSSRSMRYDPEYLQKKTGLRTFNSGVNIIGGAADAWTLTSFLHDRFPQSHPAYLWLVDVETFAPVLIKNSLSAEPRLARYLDTTPGRDGLTGRLAAIGDDLKSVLSWATARDSIRILTHRRKATRKQQAFRRQFRDNGGIAAKSMSPAQRERQRVETLARYSLLYRDTYLAMDPQAKTYVEQTLSLMNAAGSQPLIVLTPMGPVGQETLGPLGWNERHRNDPGYLLASTAIKRWMFAGVGCTPS